MLVLPLMVWAQTPVAEFHFEDEAECARWVLNPLPTNSTAMLQNRWVIGEAGSFGYTGTRGLYITSEPEDSEQKNYYTAKGGGFVTAYCSLPTLPEGDYTIRYCWHGRGKDDGTNMDAMYVCWLPETTATNCNWAERTGAIGVPSYLKNSPKRNGEKFWRCDEQTFHCTGEPGKLVVVFYNTSGVAMQPAAAIDDIIIYEALPRPLTRVEDMAINHKTKYLSWTTPGQSTMQQAGTSYLVYGYNNYDPTTVFRYEVKGAQDVLLSALMDEGMYSVHVAAVTPMGTGAWTTLNEFVWIEGARCINIFDLSADNRMSAARCWTGSTSNTKEKAGQQEVGGLYANESEYSFHTIHYDPEETDARTDHMLHTVPEGEVGSIRLNGLWNTRGNHSATIEYQYVVGADATDLLLLNYAAVLESGGHKEHEQPRFTLEILNASGQPIGGCTQGDFRAGFGDTQSWHKIPSGKEDGEGDVFWCDWTPISVTLADHVGEKLTIRLTAYSCTFDAHYGYAYFTLRCDKGALEGESCGDFEVVHFDAPEGFDYRWYEAKDAQHTTLATTSGFDLPGGREDTVVYKVDVISRLADAHEEPCYYTLTANPNPRFPVAQVMAATQQNGCENQLLIRNLSHVVRVNRKSLERAETDEDPDYVYWDFGDGSPVEYNRAAILSHVYPSAGGTYTVTCRVGISGGVCEDDTTFTITLPDIRSGERRDTLHVCDGYRDHTGRHYRSEMMGEGTQITDTIPVEANEYGCTSQLLRTVYFHLPFSHSDTARICESETYTWPVNGQEYRYTGPSLRVASAILRDTMQYTAMNGCDSVHTLMLVVQPKLRVVVDTMTYVCSDDEVIHIGYQVQTGRLASITVTFPDSAVQAGFQQEYEIEYTAENAMSVPIMIPESLRVDNYYPTITFHTATCDPVTETVCVQTQYSASIMAHMRGFMAVYNEQYNGGYRFSEYRWYEDGTLMENTSSYLESPRPDKEYYLYLVREGETAAFRTCAIHYDDPRDLEQVEAGDTPRKRIINGVLYIECHGARYDILGRRYL